jgi:hypothetical protein
VPSGVVTEKSFEKKIDKKEVDEWIPQSKSSPKIITVNNAASSIAHAVTGNNATPLINALPRPPVHANDLAQAEIVNDEPVKSGENLILTTQLPK